MPWCQTVNTCQPRCTLWLLTWTWHKWYTYLNRSIGYWAANGMPKSGGLWWSDGIHIRLWTGRGRRLRTACIKVGHLGVNEPLHTVVFVPWKRTKRNMCDFDWFWEAFSQKNLSEYMIPTGFWSSISIILFNSSWNLLQPQWWTHWWPITFTLCCLRSGNHSCFWGSHRLRQPWLTTLAG